MTMDYFLSFHVLRFYLFVMAFLITCLHICFLNDARIIKYRSCVLFISIPRTLGQSLKHRSLSATICGVNAGERGRPLLAFLL